MALLERQRRKGPDGGLVPDAATCQSKFMLPRQAH